MLNSFVFLENLIILIASLIISIYLSCVEHKSLYHNDPICSLYRLIHLLEYHAYLHTVIRQSLDVLCAVY